MRGSGIGVGIGEAKAVKRAAIGKEYGDPLPRSAPEVTAFGLHRGGTRDLERALFIIAKPVCTGREQGLALEPGGFAVGL